AAGAAARAAVGRGVRDARFGRALWFPGSGVPGAVKRDDVGGKPPQGQGDMTLRTFITAAGMLVLATGTASGQSGPSVAELLPTLVEQAAVIAPGPAGEDHSRHFLPDEATLAPLRELNRVLAVQVG